jgi:hypothetical protein
VQLSPELIQKLEGLSTSLKVYTIGVFDEEVFQLFSGLCGRDVVLDLFLTEKGIEGLKEAGMSYLKLHQIHDEGASVFQIDDGFSDFDTVLELDHRTVLCTKAGLSGFQQFQSTSPRFRDFEERFQMMAKGPDLLQTQQDINIFFGAENGRVLQDSSTQIFWEVSNAESIHISGIGEVPNTGHKRVTVFKDTVLVLQSRNGDQVRRKSLVIRVIEGLKIDYDLEFRNPASKEFSSLKNEQSCGVFGVHRGHRLRLSWNIPEAEEVLVEPFGKRSNSGSVEFMPNGIQKIRIRVWLQGKETTQEVVVQEYPVDLIYDRFVDIEEKYLPSMKISAKNHFQDMSAYLEKQNLLDPPLYLLEIKRKSEEQARSLSALSKRFSFEEFYLENDLGELSRMTQKRLKAYFRDKPKVLEMLNSIRNYYH